MARQTDTDAGIESSVGISNVPPVGRALHEAQPNWLTDGYGIRGPQRQTPAEETNVRPFPMEARVFKAVGDDAPPASGGASSLTVTDGSATVSNVTTLSFDGTFFVVSDYGGGEAHVACNE